MTEPADNPYDPPSAPPPTPPPHAPTGDATGGLIPYKNGPALSAYYCGIFALLPCLGLVLGPIAFVLGILGLKKRAREPEVKGGVHAWIGILFGGLSFLGNVAGLLLVVVGANS